MRPDTPRVSALVLLLVLCVSACLARPARAAWDAERWRACRAEGMRGNMFAPEDAPETTPAPELARAARAASWRRPLERATHVPPSPFGTATPAALRARLAGADQVALGTDVRVHDRGPAPCAGCGSGWFAQVEPTVAMLGTRVVATFNDNRSRCAGWERQGVSWSADGGRTFRDTHGLPANVPGIAHLAGDPSVAVNAATGDFYVAGFASTLGDLGSEGRLGIARGRFGAAGFAFDRGVETSTTAAEFWDKPFMAVDPRSGRVYLAWTNFPDAGPIVILFQRFDANLVPLGGPVALSNPNDSASPQFPMPAVGPDGELYVAWWVAESNSALSRIRIRRSDDGGASFGPVREVASFDGNLWNGAPGMQRPFGPMAISIAVDRTDGPYRGRVYLAWDQALPHLAFRTCDTTSAVESEPNDDFAHADPFVPGGWLRGTVTPGEHDQFAVTLARGQSLFMCEDRDSVLDGLAVRVWARTDLGGAPRQLATSTLAWGGVLVSAPSDGTYDVELLGVDGAGAVPYRVATHVLAPAPGDVARDVRDGMVAWSDDGVAWSAPRRVTDSAPGFDGTYTSLAVDARGRVHAFWLDYRPDSLTGTFATPYTASSGDGGVTWGANRRMGDHLSDFQVASCISNHNSLGDYVQVVADGDRVAAIFPDTRDGDQDIWLDVASYALALRAPRENFVAEGRDTAVVFELVNAGTHARPLAWRAVADAALAAWTGEVAGEALVAAGETLRVAVPVAAGACPGAAANLRLVVEGADVPGAADTVATLVRCLPAGAAGTLATLAALATGPGWAQLEWRAPGFANHPVAIERGTDGTHWVRLTGATTDDAGRVAYRDADVVPGYRYAWRLALDLGGGFAWTTPPAWLDVPAFPALALRGAGPNPARGAPTLRFALPGDGPARLEVFDLLGRQVRAYDVGARGAGEHALALGDGAPWPPGVYLARLTRAGEVRRTRFVIAP